MLPFPYYLTGWVTCIANTAYDWLFSSARPRPAKRPAKQRSHAHVTHRGLLTGSGNFSSARLV
ncbi:MAG: hypothetical protein II870_08175 [Synergistaceae bacterium]|nr:hypothetical protein [Synergistaceae bacterium]MBR0043688.1 hypothetical protein [Synergistaceae bacterium]